MPIVVDQQYGSLLFHISPAVPRKSDSLGGSNNVAAAGGACVGTDVTDAYVFAWSMRDNAWTNAARLRPGDPVRMRLRPWADVARDVEFINRSEIDDEALWMEEPLWGEINR